MSTTPWIAITLRNSQIARPVDIPIGWKTLRVGIRCSITSGSSGTISGTPRFTLGFCSGSALYGDVTTGHFAGIQTNSATLAYVSNGLTYNTCANYAAAIRTLKKVGTLETQFSSDIESSNTFFVNDRPAMWWKKSILYFDLTRPTDSNNSGSVPSGSYSVGYGRCTDWQSSGYFNISEMTFLKELGSQSPDVNTGGWTYSANVGTMNIDETVDGYFDSVYVSWDREGGSSELKIEQIGVAIFN